jgi:hypothetical protein
MRPILRLGSYGPAVRDLQGLLNSKPSALPRLDPDGAFGGRTAARVKEFQLSKGLTPDGVVGNNTWNALLGGTGGAGDPGGKPGGTTNGTPPPGTNTEPPTPGVSPGTEDAARQRIVEVALKDFNAYGRWGKDDRPSVDNPKVAGKLCADQATRARQGGKHICEIFQLAGGPSPTRCLTISPAAVSMYQRSYTASERNNTDIVSWCGIFSLYVLKTAGLRLSGWPLKYSIGKVKPTDELRIKLGNQTPKPGDIGVIEPTGTNHHFVVTAADGGSVKSVDGNAGMLMEIVEQTRAMSTIQSKGGYWLEPVWERVL